MRTTFAFFNFIAKSLFAIALRVFAFLFIAIMVITVSGVSPFAALTIVAGITVMASLHVTPAGLLFTAPTDSLNLATLASDIQAYYMEYDQMIHDELQIGLFDDGPANLNLGDRYTLIPDIIDEIALQNDVMNDFLHQENPSSATTFNPTASAITPGGNILKVRKYEGDLQFRDNEIETSFLTYRGEMKLLAKNMGADAVQSFVEYLFWKTIIPKAKQNLRRAIIQGVYNATASFSLLNICDGVQQQIANAITAGSITATAMTSPTVNNVIALVESVFDTLGIAYQYADDLVVQLSPAMYKLYIRANRLQSGTGRDFTQMTGQKDQYPLTIDKYPNAKIVMEPYLTGNEVLISRKFNNVIGLSAVDNVGTWEFQRLDRLTKFMVNGKVGVSFRAINLDSSNLNVAYGA